MSENKKRQDNDMAIKIIRWLLNFAGEILSKTPITANQITLLRFFLVTPVILTLFSQGSYVLSILGLLGVFLYTVLDLLDGIVARKKGLASDYGKWLDTGLDAFYQQLLLIALTIGVANKTSEPSWYIVGMFLMLGQSMANTWGTRFELLFGFDGYTGSDSFRAFISRQQQLSLWDKFLSNIIVPSNFTYIFIFCMRYTLVFGVLFNRLEWFLVFFATTINIRWLTLYYIYMKYLDPKETSLATINYLKKKEYKK